MWGEGEFRVTRMRCPNCSDIDSCYFEKWKRVACAFGSVFGGGLELHVGQPWQHLLRHPVIVLVVGFAERRWAGRLCGQEGRAGAQRAPGTVQRGEKIGIIVTHPSH